MAMKGTFAVAVALTATPVLANNPPGPHILLAEVSILPLMVLFTAIGGGYTLLRKRSTSRTVGWVIGVIAMIVFSAVNEALGALVALIFGIFAIARGVRLIAWGISAAIARRNTESVRLIASGVLLIPITAFLAGMTLAFLNYWPVSNEHDQVAALREYVAIRQALNTPPSPQREALAQKAGTRLAELRDTMDGYSSRHKRLRIDEGENPAHFVIYLLPNVRHFPFPPYDRLVSVATYRADDSGAIRMARVHSADALCPAEAPVIDRVGPNDVKRALAGEAFR